MKNRKVIVGVTGGIAAYKTAELVRLLLKEKAHVRVAMTENAARFVAPLTFEALSGSPVIQDMWQHGRSMDHIFWGQESDLIIIAPATANFLAKLAHGIGDDFLSTLLIAATARILICPSMNDQMFLNPIVQDNLRLLKERGMAVMQPGEGPLACRTSGPGRLPEPEDILEYAGCLLTEQNLSGLRILVTAGPTVEPIDPVRFISNRSSGKMGYALARAARRRGAKVTLVSGPCSQTPPYGVAFLPVKTAEDMRRAVLENQSETDILIKAAAVCDFRPKTVQAQKIKKGSGAPVLKLVKNPDILTELGEMRANRACLLVGFAAETEEIIAHAEEKLKKKHLDMIVANDVSRKDAGFESDTNMVKVLYKGGRIEETPLMKKTEVADLVLDRAKALWSERFGN